MEQSKAQQLADAFVRLASELEDVSSDERLSHIETLVFFSSFARASGLGTASQRLHDLSAEMADLYDGRVSPLFKPVKKGRGSRTDGIRVWQRRQRVLWAKRHLEKSEMGGMKKLDAARFIADAYPGVGSLMTRGKDVPQTILGWEEDLEYAKPSEPHLWIWGHHLVNEIYPDIDAAPLTFDEHKAAAIRILDGLFGAAP